MTHPLYTSPLHTLFTHPIYKSPLHISVGYIKTYKNLQSLLVLNSGHMVPMDVPKIALDMISKFLNDKEFSAGNALVGVSLINPEEIRCENGGPTRATKRGAGSDIPHQHTLSIHSIDPPYHTPSTQPTTHTINTPYQSTLSTHPINTLYQHTLCNPYLYNHTPNTTLIPLYPYPTLLLSLPGH